MFKKGVNDIDDDGVVTHLELDILECGPYEVGLTKHYYKQS